MKWLLILLLAMPAFGQWQLQGQGRYSYLFWDLYDARYYKAEDGQALSLTYLRAIDADDILAQTRKEWRRLDLGQPQWLAWLARYCPDVQAGDELRLEVQQQQSRLYFNGQLLASNDDPAFGPAFLAIWLSHKTRAPGLRQALLGKEEQCETC
ncbi:chalcone isomerase family protein [Gallaecimonas xiamenensis]|uniref:Chalcone isomerase domain-containing protein n=1 Tax=Gallaecimonas xiamenensis 3-C-1 TaxID=745411 RepID=K2KHH9_9GAMM|nr:chalcone isomerase family protein [Gallaecimonas xiamenensis]EKE76720.1 hypothetical protein B3C1_03965 [Gallaecimonas xiamenensis 3-C-1]